MRLVSDGRSCDVGCTGVGLNEVRYYLWDASFFFFTYLLSSLLLFYIAPFRVMIRNHILAVWSNGSQKYWLWLWLLPSCFTLQLCLFQLAAVQMHRLAHQPARKSVYIDMFRKEIIILSWTLCEGNKISGYLSHMYRGLVRGSPETLHRMNYFYNISVNETSRFCNLPPSSKVN